ncbi:MAG: bifunctional adenosylcobinamide kinase/adenosylcobinamide-phosphate guanylyltransferase [Coriobacteriia bacterium]|nr:bifunctional adenosylcobinamide kinase/adenosylcobinamide-phosphate guanylyltransferase [Coriobacteriia bacterium]
MLAVLTGPVRSGKSRFGLDLALSSGAPVVIAVGAQPDDSEMERRIARHQADRPAGISVVETSADRGWLAAVPEDACLVVDCLGTVLGGILAGLLESGVEVADASAEQQAEEAAGTLVKGLVTRTGPTVVVTNEVGWGVVPATALGRLFRDVLGRANRDLVDQADAAWLVVAGRCIDLGAAGREVSWPTT